MWGFVGIPLYFVYFHELLVVFSGVWPIFRGRFGVCLRFCVVFVRFRGFSRVFCGYFVFLCGVASFSWFSSERA